LSLLVEHRFAVITKLLAAVFLPDSEAVLAAPVVEILEQVVDGFHGHILL
jgi:hypothetical protein